MQLLNSLGTMLLLLILLGLSSLTFAQDEPKKQMSPEETKQLMDAISQKMRDLEQMLAKASLQPEDLAMIIDQLKTAVQEKDYDRLPGSLREFLLNNPQLLSQLKNPEQSGEELQQTEDEIRRLLATDDHGVEKLLKDNPEMLERLLQQQDKMEEALKEHSSMENNLERLFNRTSDQMESTEGDIQKLIEAAEQMQQQMNQSAQQQQNQLNQPSPSPKPDGQNNNDNDSVTDPKGQEQNPESGPDSGKTPTGPSATTDQNAWDTILPRVGKERGTDPTRQPTPKGWASEAASYFKLLAEQARIERLRKLERENREGR